MLSRIVIISMLASLCGTVHAHKINPLQDKYKQDSRAITRGISEPVHEEITQLARACQLAHPGPVASPLVCTDRTERIKTPEGNKYDSLVRGVWWNDDPNQLLFTKPWKWLAWMDDAENIARCNRNWKGRAATIDASYYLTYRSHYGDLQFIHSMASTNGEAARATQQNILAWAEFTYAAATGSLDMEATVDTATPRHLQPYFSQQSGWTTNYLFAPRYRLKTADHNRLMAAGSLLHMVQDSYSAAHTRRAYDASPSCPAGRVVQFHSYIDQDPKKHATADRRQAWADQQFTAQQDPVNVSATLLAYIAQRAPWDTVEAYLRDTVFCVDENTEDAGAGEFLVVSTEGAVP